MQDRLNLEVLRRKGTGWKKSLGVRRIIWIMIGVFLVLSIATSSQTALTPSSTLAERNQSLLNSTFLLGFILLLVIALTPIARYSLEIDRIKRKITKALKRDYPPFAALKNVRKLPTYLDGARSLNSAKDGKILSQSFAEHDYDSIKAIIAENMGAFPPVDMTLPEAMLHHMRGRYDQAESLYWTLLAGTLRKGNPLTVATVLSNLADTYTMRGQFDQALPLIEHALTIAPNFYYPYVTLCDYYLHLPQNPYPQRAVQMAELAREVLPVRFSLPQISYFQIINAFYAHALANAGDIERAKAILAELQPYIEQMASTGLESLYQMAHAYRLIGEVDTARTLYERVRSRDVGGRLEALAALNIAPES